MKRNIVQIGFAACGLALAASAGAQSLTLTQVFLTSGSLAGLAPNAFCYSSVANTCIVATAATPVNAFKYNGNNGAASGTMNMTGIDTTGDSLSCFALGTDSAGEIIGFSSSANCFDVWANIGATCTTATLGASGNFVRNMDAADVLTSAGTVSLLATSSGENDTHPSHLWQKVGANFVNLGEVGTVADVGVHCCKAGTTISDDGQYIVGCAGSASTPLQGVYIFRNGTGGPLNSIFASAWTYVASVDVGSFYGDVAIDASKDVGFGLKLTAATPAITMFRLSTGLILASVPINLTPLGAASIGTARGGLDLEKSTQRLYMMCRFPADAGGDAAIGRFDYVAVVTAANDWNMYE